VERQDQASDLAILYYATILREKEVFFVSLIYIWFKTWYEGNFRFCFQTGMASPAVIE